jgi:prepilin-type N-terminal cleavage/methylation domain-containing protein
MFEQRIGKRLARRARLAGATQRLAQRARQVCASSSGMSLVEVLVASAIIAIVSVLLVVAFYTMGSVSMRAADITNADEQLSSDIALNPKGKGEEGSITLKGEDGKPILGEGEEHIEIPLNSNKYETQDGRSLWTFGYSGD